MWTTGLRGRLHSAQGESLTASAVNIRPDGFLSVYLGDGELQALHRLRLLKDLYLLNDVDLALQQHRFVQVTRL